MNPLWRAEAQPSCKHIWNTTADRYLHCSGNPLKQAQCLLHLSTPYQRFPQLRSTLEECPERPSSNANSTKCSPHLDTVAPSSYPPNDRTVLPIADDNTVC
ncbi:Hypothetical predicted protein [Pelobates cultripes]|uniref:Uncharacterized protein n=1 Tax=Pelobates cultripes TaxID=61616 RepID=A0AAD1T985_PELCU|nr:Hypothetical predicted protein [Pelobates cultripes]